MERNVGSTDSVLRAMVGLCLLMTGAALSSVWIASAALVVVSLVLLYTALTERCPAYRALGWTTRRQTPPPVRPSPHTPA
jgi:hypothetical protein